MTGNNGNKGNDGQTYGVMMHKNTAKYTNFMVFRSKYNIVTTVEKTQLEKCPEVSKIVHFMDQ